MSEDTKTPAIVDLYCRVSSDEQVKTGCSLPDQERRLKLRAESEQWQVHAIYKDEGITGHIDTRPGLQNLVNDAREGKINLIVCTQLDRFFRENRLQLNYVNDFKKAGVDLLAIDDHIDTREPGYKIMLSFMGSMAEAEHDKIGMRVQLFRARAKFQNQWTAGRVLYGYRFNKTTKELEIYEPEAKAVRFAFDEYTKAEPIGLYKIAFIMNKEGYMPPRANRKNQKSDFWTQSTVRHILTRAAYYGGPNDNYPYRTPAIITFELWKAAQSRLATNIHFKPGGRGKTQYHGRLICGLCGRHLVIGWNGGENRVYECPGRKKQTHPDGSSLCTLPRMNAEKLEKDITNKIQQIYGNPKLLIEYIENYKNNMEAEKEALSTQLKPLQNEANEIKEEMAIIDTRFEMKRINRDDYKLRMMDLQSKLASIEGREENLDPAMVRDIRIYDAGIIYCETILKVLHKMIASDYQFLKEYPDAEEKDVRLLQKSTEQFSKKTFSKLQKTIILGENPIADAFKNFIVYPDKIELKGNIKIEKGNILPTCR